jgi:hypothetical protein
VVDGLDGWGNSVNKLIILSLLGLPMALILLINLSVLYRSLYQRRGLPISSWRSALVNGGLGILVGTIVSVLVIAYGGNEINRCHSLNRQRHGGESTAKAQAEQPKTFESQNCPAMLGTGDRPPQEISDRRKGFYVITGFLSPTLGMVAGFFGTLRSARLRRRSRL